MDAKTLREKLAGAELDLQDEVAVAHFQLSADGDGVSATLGTRGGPVCAPLLRYVITDDAQVKIFDAHAILIVWEQVEFSDGFMTVGSGEHVRRFGFTPGKKRKRYLP